MQLNKQNLRILDQLSKRLDDSKKKSGELHSYQLGHSWNFKFKDFTDQFYHLEDLLLDDNNNPVEQHNKLF